jgi:NDP-sugar pyrophosphorylase family protein
LDRPIDASQLRVVIPVGGEATRLKPLTVEVSKAVVRIFNRPIVEFALLELARQGVRNFIFGAKGYVNYRCLFDYFGEGIGFSCQYGISPRVHIKYQPHIDDVGSADSIRINMDYYNLNDPLLVVQGDNIFSLDLNGMLSVMRRTNALMVVALMWAEDVEAYGIADLGPGDRIRGFVEKPKKEDAPSRFANTGIYLLAPEVRKVFNHPDVQKMIKKNGRLDFGLDFIPYLVRHGHQVYGYHLEQEWYDVGTPKGYIDTMRNVLNSGERAKFYLGDPVPTLGNVWIQGSSIESLIRKEELIKRAIEGTIKLEGSVLIGRHCQIGDGTIIRDSCIDNFCVIGKNVTVERSAIMDRTLVEDSAYIQDSIIGRHVRVRSSEQVPSWIVGLSVIGDDVTIGKGRTLAAMKVDPHRVIPDEQATAIEIRNKGSSLLAERPVPTTSLQRRPDGEESATG